ncbi:MAG: twitching motility protein PilT [Egibacteraceae bacterium]
MNGEGLTYDTGALIAAERDDRLLWSLHRAALKRGLSPVVPAGVLAQGWRGGPQHQLSRLLKGCEVEALTEQQARRVGTLAARSGIHDTVDVTVVEGAVRRGNAVITSDPSHLQIVAEAAGYPLTLRVV